MVAIFSQDMITLLFYAGVSFGFLHLFYIAFANTRWDEEEIENLNQRELHLAHLVKLLDAPDVRAMSRDRTQRRGLFSGMSRFLLADVRELLRSNSLGLSTLLWGGLFILGYTLVKAKSVISWGRNDLHFLAGLELAVVRSLAKNR